jgi:raffinose/stachyose/melibiose transport system permease protein
MKTNNKKLSRTIASIVLAVICVFYVYPIFTILINSLKMNKAITTTGVFQLPSADNFVGLANYVEGITSMNFLKSFWYSLVISVMSVVLIMLCCSMAAWYIIPVNGPLS